MSGIEFIISGVFRGKSGPGECNFRPGTARAPDGIKRARLRQQFVDVIDITPTALDLAGIEAPAVFQGVAQIPVQGRSIRRAVIDPASASPRDTQYFELSGSRAIYHQALRFAASLDCKEVRRARALAQRLNKAWNLIDQLSMPKVVSDEKTKAG